MITPLPEPLVNNNLLPAEVFLLSRLDQPMSLRDLVAVSGLGEKETLQLVYSLALAGVVQREHWNSVFRDQKPAPPSRPVAPSRRAGSATCRARATSRDRPNGRREFSRASEELRKRITRCSALIVRSRLRV